MTTTHVSSLKLMRSTIVINSTDFQLW